MTKTTSPTVAAMDTTPRMSKLDLLFGLLKASDDATMKQMMDATGWQQHSVRGAMAGALRKRGLKTSMGRLTLNVLLSFAQFEREVTGERIRDKIAASKKKGLWMGGRPVFGYDPDGRILKINPAEAEEVRWMFARYLEIRSVNKLVAELKARGVTSNRWINRAGEAQVGVPLVRGVLYRMLRNPIYVGDIPARTPCILGSPWHHRPGDGRGRPGGSRPKCTTSAARQGPTAASRRTSYWLGLRQRWTFDVAGQRLAKGWHNLSLLRLMRGSAGQASRSRRSQARPRACD